MQKLEAVGKLKGCQHEPVISNLFSSCGCW